MQLLQTRCLFKIEILLFEQTAPSRKLWSVWVIKLKQINLVQFLPDSATASFTIQFMYNHVSNLLCMYVRGW